MKYFICFFSSVLFSQTLYQGSLDFAYDGSETGSFSTTYEDTTNFTGALNLTLNDSALFMMMGIAQRQSESFDLFLTILQDSIYPIQPRNWSWDITFTEIIDIMSDPLSLPNLSVFVPNIDSSQANQWIALFADTSNLNDSLSLDVLTDFFIENLLSEAYLAISGNVSINNTGSNYLSGNLSLSMIKPALPFPNIEIDTGSFNFTTLIEGNLHTNQEKYIPKLVHIEKAYPNPFNPEIKIPFSLQRKQQIKVSIFDINGKLISILSDQNYSQGNHLIRFSNHELSSGIYYINILHKNGSETQKITYLK